MAMPRPTATSTSASKTTAVGTFDQLKRWSSALTTSNAVHQRYTPATMIFCRGSGSAVGPPFIRRRRTSGLLKAQQMLGPAVTSANTARAQGGGEGSEILPQTIEPRATISHAASFSARARAAALVASSRSRRAWSSSTCSAPRW
jgi:hypothetical protein